MPKSTPRSEKKKNLIYEQHGLIEVETYPEPSFSILCNDQLAVGQPVPVPFPESGTVVDTTGINVLYLKPT